MFSLIFLVSSAYKWLLCPNGLAFLYVKPAHHGGQPIEHNEYNHPRTAASIEGQLLYDETFSDGARRFDMGQTRNMILLPMAQAALEQITVWTPEAIAAALAPMTRVIAQRASELGYALPPEPHRAGHLIGLKKKTSPPADLIPALAGRGIHASMRCGRLRLAPYVHVTEDDLERLLEAIETVWY